MLVAPAAASAQSTTPAPARRRRRRRGAPRRAREGQAAAQARSASAAAACSRDALGRARHAQAVRRRPAGERALLPPRPARSPSTQVAIKPAGGKAGRFALGFRAKTPGHDHRPGDATARRPSWRRSSRRACASSVLPLRATPGARGLAVRVLQQRLVAPGLRRRAARPLRRPHRAGGHGVPQGHRDGAHERRQRRGVPPARRGPGPLPRALPQPRPARRGRHRPPGARADQRADASSGSTR